MTHASHPGHGTDCELQGRVVPHRYGSSSAGYNCSWTGGHCVPGESCAERRASNKTQEDAMADIIARMPMQEFPMGNWSRR